MTPEEQAVIEAAKRWRKSEGSFQEVADAVDALNPPDIVVRLREFARLDGYEIASDAADEIERLRSVQTLNSEAERNAHVKAHVETFRQRVCALLTERAKNSMREWYRNAVEDLITEIREMS